MGEPELLHLTEDIKAHGLREKITLYEGKVLDGRNRFLVCQSLKIRSETKDFAGSHLDALAFVWSENFHRRHLNPSQAAVAEARRVKVSQEYAAEVDKMKTEAREKKKEGGKKGGKAGGKGRPKKDRHGERIPQAYREPRTSTRRAKAVGTNRKYLETAETLLETDPKRLEDVEGGKKTLSEVIRELRKEEQAAKRKAAIKEGKKIKDETVFRLPIEEIQSDPNSIDLIFTDPPYDDQHIEHYTMAAKLAKSCLKSGRFFCCYVGKLRLPQVINAIIPYLEYVWIIAAFHSFSKEKHLGNPYQFAENWRPVLVFKKAGKAEVCKFQQDVVRAERDKTFHDWQQDIKTPLQLIEAYTEPGELVVDPFCGGGTTLVAAKRLGRKWLGFDISEESVALSKKRLQDDGNN
jgi:hypothetical protein